MSTFAASFKAEVVRLARKEAKAAVTPIKKPSGSNRKALVDLKRRVATLEKECRRLGGLLAKVPQPKTEPAEGQKARITAKGLRSLRRKLGLTGEEIAGGVYQPGSCDQCGHTGHVGRISVRSLVPLTGEPADLVRHEAGSREVTRCVEALARAALCRAGLAHVVAGHISLAELVRVVGE